MVSVILFNVTSKLLCISVKTVSIDSHLLAKLNNAAVKFYFI